MDVVSYVIAIQRVALVLSKTCVNYILVGSNGRIWEKSNDVFSWRPTTGDKNIEGAACVDKYLVQFAPHISD